MSNNFPILVLESFGQQMLRCESGHQYERAQPELRFRFPTRHMVHNTCYINNGYWMQTRSQLRVRTFPPPALARGNTFYPETRDRAFWHQHYSIDLVRL